MPNFLPNWLTVKAPSPGVYDEVADYLKSMKLNTVCQSAGCPNIGECFSRHTATFMILGNTCTRNCGFCGVKHGLPDRLDVSEPQRVAEASEKMKLHYIVVTSVTRDDLPDGGAHQFADTISAIRERIPEAKVEVLIPDFGGNTDSLKVVLDAEPFVLNHNIETVPRLYKNARPQADYNRSLNLLETVKAITPSIYTKSGMMVGLGETDDEVVQALKDLRSVGCDVITIGQYLRPSKENLEVAEFVHPDKFEYYRKIAFDLGFLYAAAGPFVRSSYHAAEIIK